MNAVTPAVDSAARRFLQSVLVVDDRAQLGPTVHAGQLVEPDPKAEPEQASADADETLAPTEPPESVLNAKELVDSFAAAGLVCGVMRPNPPAEPETRVVIPVAARADIVVLDWHLRDRGERALGILDALAKEPGLRLAAVYTYDDALEDIAKNIGEQLGGTRPGDFTVTVGSLVIELYAKVGTHVDGAASDRVKTPDQLSRTLIEDFERLTSGLIPTAAVAAVGALRRNTPLLLSLLTSDLDAGYLGHRLLLPDPGDSERHLLDLIGAEMRAVIEDDPIVRAEIGQLALARHVERLPTYEQQLPQTVICRALELGTASEQARAQLEALPPVRTEQGSAKLLARKPSQTYRFTGGDPSRGEQADLIFGCRLSLRSITDTPPPLQLGTFVRKKDDWLVCVQPDCDAVRISGARQFPFLSAVVVGFDKRVDAVVMIGREYVGLHIDQALHHLRLITFTADPTTGTVTAVRDNDEWVFPSQDDGAYKFVAQYKRDHARRLAERFGQAGSRIGLDESEMFRRWGER